jgi:hypothetical protein
MYNEESFMLPTKKEGKPGYREGKEARVAATIRENSPQFREMCPTGKLDSDTNPKAQRIQAIISPFTYSLANLIIMLKFLRTAGVVRKWCHAAERSKWLATWLLFPYWRYLQHFFALRLFAFQRAPGEEAPPIPPFPAFELELELEPEPGAALPVEFGFGGGAPAEEGEEFPGLFDGNYDPFDPMVGSPSEFDSSFN